MIIIGLIGPAGAGKSTVASHLEDVYGAKRYSLAAPLKIIAKRALDLTEEQVNGTQAQKAEIDSRYGFSPRWFLQRLGTEGIRAVFGPDVWVHHLLDKVEADNPDIAVIEDVRFVNEVTQLRLYPSYHTASKCDVSIWRLAPPGINEIEATPVNMHDSEFEWRKITPDFAYEAQTLGTESLLGFANVTALKCGLFQVQREVAL